MRRKRIFQQPLAAMPISGYASAIFFARRKRVTLQSGCQAYRTVAIAISKRLPDHAPSRSPRPSGVFISPSACIHKPAFRHTVKLQRVKIRVRKNFARCDPRSNAPAKRKSPALPGFLTNIFFDQFISPAWRSDAPAAKPFGSHCSCE